MDNNDKKILLLADLHYMVVSPEKQKGQVKTGLNRIVEWFIDIWKRKNKKAIDEVLIKAQLFNPFEKVIILGDLIECEYNERGIIMENDIKVISRLKNKLKSEFSSAEIIYTPGDHELGYSLPLSIDPQGGISQKSLDNFQKTLGPLFQHFEIDEHHFIIFNSSLADQDFSQRPEEERIFIEKLKNEQADFLIDTLKKAEHGEKIFVFLHNPDSLVDISKIIPDSLIEKISVVFCGHLHTSKSLIIYKWAGYISRSFLKIFFIWNPNGKKMIEWAKGNDTRLKTFKKFKLQVVSAPGGLMGLDKGFTVLHLDQDNYKMQKVIL